VTDQQLAPGSKSDTAAPVEFTLKGRDANSSINKIPIWVEFGKETKKLNQVFGNEEGSTGYIPRCLLVPLGTPWATERTPIDEAYADFSDYVQNMKDCWDYAAPSAVYPGSDAMGLKAEPEEAYEVVKYDIVEPTTTTDTQDGGEYYDYHEIEVDQVVPEMVGTSLNIEGAGSLNQYYGTTRIDDSYAYIRGSEFPETGYVTLRIYGIGADNDGYLWRLYTGTANSNLGGGDGTQYSYNNEAGRTSLAANGYIETTVEAATLHSTGWYLAGCNFTLLGVTIVTEDDLKEDTKDTTLPGQIWPDSGAGSEANVSLSVNDAKTAFANATSSNKLCIYTDTASGWMQFYFGYWPTMSDILGSSAPSGWYIDGQVIRPNAGPTNGKFEIQLSDVIIAKIKEQGFGIQGSYNITNITIE